MTLPDTPAAVDRGGPAQPLLALDGLRKHFSIRGGLFGRTVATVRAVDGVSFAVRKGETLGIVGESGCGKSTTAHLLMRLLEPDAGTMDFEGEGVGQSGQAGGIGLKDYRRQVQMVFQDSYASLNPRLPIEDTIAFAPRVHGVPAAGSRWCSRPATPRPPRACRWRTASPSRRAPTAPPRRGRGGGRASC